MTSSLKALLGAAALLCAASVAASAAPAYRLVDLGVAAGYTSSFAYGISDDGQQVAGWVASASGGTQATSWSAGGGITLLGGASGATASRAFGINDAGQAVGEMSFGSRREGTLWTAAAPAGLGTLSNAGSSVAFGVNNAGTVVGWSDSSVGTRAFSWAGAGPMQSLGALPGGTQTRAYGINAAGQATGWGTSPAGDRGFVDDGGLVAIPTLQAGAGRTRAFGNANFNGWVTGDAQDPALGDVAFAWSPATGTISLGLINGAARSFGADINSAGTAVGWADGLPSGEQATLWTAATGLLAIDGLLVDANGWSVQRARAISDNGHIVGHAIDAQGVVHAVLLTPVPELSTWLMMGLGLAGLGAVRRRARR